MLGIYHCIRTSMWLLHLLVALNPAASLASHQRYGNEDVHYFDPSYQEPDQGWWVSEIAVDPDFQRRGLGTLLLQ
jgi:ribosomal protein S18 acetylase RimI-like enzyme